MKISIIKSSHKVKFNILIIKIILLHTTVIINTSITTALVTFQPCHGSNSKRKYYSPFIIPATSTVTKINSITGSSLSNAQRPQQQEHVIGIDDTTTISKNNTNTNNNNKNNITLPPSSTRYSAVLNISYDGRNYYGWSSSNDDNNTNKNIRQRRSKRRRGKYINNPSHHNVRSIQGTLQKCLSKLYGDVPIQNINITGCSRTDKGVHAKSYICKFECCIVVDEATTAHDQNKLPLPFNGNISKISFVLNRMLPDDIRVLGISPLPCNNNNISFHPTVDALVKTYKYTFSVGNNNMHDPLGYRYTWHVPSISQFNISQVRECSTILQGVHNFTAFQGAFRGSDRYRKYTINPVCHVTQINIQEDDNDTPLMKEPLLLSQMNGTATSFHSYHSIKTYTITITGTRFLYKMVRFIIGSLVAVGKGTTSIDDVKYALHNGIRNDHMMKYVTCAPPHGLTLTDVQYSDNCTNNSDFFTWAT